jgi:hypothetical protein
MKKKRKQQGAFSLSPRAWFRRDKQIRETELPPPFFFARDADNKKVKKLFIFAALLVVCASPPFAEIFSYKQSPGDKWRIISTVEEDVIINGQFSHHPEIAERVACETTGMASPEEALIQAVFRSAEKAVNQDGTERFVWSGDYGARFTRTSQGRIQIQPGCFRPATRNVPTFPAADVREGQTWQAPGQGTSSPMQRKCPITPRSILKRLSKAQKLRLCGA